jgi:hypothetical protein
MGHHGRHHAGMTGDGFADALDDAKRDFAAAWRRWLAKTGKPRVVISAPLACHSVRTGQLQS